MEKEKVKRLKIRRYLDGLYSKSEVSDLAKDMQNSEMFDTIDDITKEVWEESMRQDSYLCDMEHEKYKREAAWLLGRINKRSVKRKKYTGWVAACIFLVLGTGLGIGYQSTHETEILYAEISTASGEKKEWVLPDGSKVKLNACTTLKYPRVFEGKERKIELKGEAYFQVTRNEEQPFVIHTSEFNVRVLGTSFDIKAYPDNEIAQVCVETGKVEVCLSEAMMRLMANEQVQINTRTNEYVKKKEDHRQAMTWLQGKLHYNNTPLLDVVKDLERIYNCRIKVAEGQSINCKLSGDHDNESLQAVLQSIEYVTGMKHKHEGECIILYQ